VSPAAASVRLDLNNPEFQQALFRLQKNQAASVLGTLRKIAALTWTQVYHDVGLNWEEIKSRRGPNDEKLYSFRIGQDFRGVALRDGEWMRVLELFPEHDATYRKR
jgi:hypothetical protein